jgi:signal transduction histidine kinase
MQRGTEQAFRDGNLFDDPFSAPFIEQGARDTYHVCGRMYYPELGIDKYIESRTQPVFDDEGHQVYYVVTARDVTAEREMYMRQREHDRQLQQTNDRINSYEQQLRYLLVESKMWVWRFDLKTRRINFSRSLRQGEIDEPIRSYISRLSERFHGYANDNLRDIMRNGKPFRLIREFNDNILSGGGHSWNGISGIPLRDKDGKIYQYFGITRDISDLMAAQERLRQETARAEDSGRMKAAFLANMTHEIRTPLNAIVGFSDLLQEIDSAEERQEFIRIIRDNCDMLLRLINDILEASSMGQSLAIHPLKVDLPSIFDDICQTLAQRVQEPGVEFIKDNPLSDYPATLDRGRLQQMLTNFVTNAVKYTHQGHIKVGWRSEEREGIDGIYFYCEDTGAGIPQDKQASVFERFVKLNDFVQGTGLGLSICKAIVEKCGGEIGVDSEVGKGSTFWFRIPVEE